MAAHNLRFAPPACSSSQSHADTRTVSYSVTVANGHAIKENCEDGIMKYEWLDYSVVFGWLAVYVVIAARCLVEFATA